MKQIGAIMFLILLISVQANRKLHSTTEKTNMKVSKTGINLTLEELTRMRQMDGTFDPNKVTKYYKNQKPYTNPSEAFTDTLFSPSSASIEGRDASGKFLSPEGEIESQNLMGSEWKRAKDIFNNKPYFVFKDAIEPQT